MKNKKTSPLYSWLILFALSFTLTSTLLFLDFTNSSRSFMELDKSIKFGLLMSLMHMLFFSVAFIPIIIISKKIESILSWKFLVPYMVTAAFLSSVLLLVGMETPPDHAVTVSIFIALFYGMLSGMVCSLTTKQKTQQVGVRQ
jgi:hypothetical protein